jgi:hypothetical protein
MTAAYVVGGAAWVVTYAALIHRGFRDKAFGMPLVPQIGWPEGVSPSGSLRSRRDSLLSPGSCHPAHQAVVTQRQCAKTRGYLSVISVSLARAARVAS